MIDRHLSITSGTPTVRRAIWLRYHLILSRAATPPAGLTSPRIGKLKVWTSASEYSFEYMKFLNSSPALGWGASFMIPTGAAMRMASSVGKVMSIGLPAFFLASEKLSGPAPTWRSPPTMSVTVSLTDRLILGFSLARSFRYWSPYLSTIASTQFPT